MNLGTALRDQHKFDQAVAQYRQALDHDPALAEAHYNLGLLLQQLAEAMRGQSNTERTLALEPEHGPAKFARCMAALPILYTDEPEIGRRRSAYRQRLRELCERNRSKGAGDELAAAVGSNQPFFLAYQQQNDRELQAQYGATVCRIMAEKYPTPTLRRPPRSGAGRSGLRFFLQSHYLEAFYQRLAEPARPPSIPGIRLPHRDRARRGHHSVGRSL